MEESNENSMKKKTKKRRRRTELRKEYDLSALKGGVRGKYTERYLAESNIGVLSADDVRFAEAVKRGEAQLEGGKIPNS
jgi:hypothetical protein